MLFLRRSKNHAVWSIIQSSICASGCMGDAPKQGVQSGHGIRVGTQVDAHLKEKHTNLASGQPQKPDDPRTRACSHPDAPFFKSQFSEGPFM